MYVQHVNVVLLAINSNLIFIVQLMLINFINNNSNNITSTYMHVYDQWILYCIASKMLQCSLVMNFAAEKSVFSIKTINFHYHIDEG